MTCRQESSPNIGEFTAVHPDDGAKQSQFQGAGRKEQEAAEMVCQNKANCVASILPAIRRRDTFDTALSRQTKPIRRVVPRKTGRSSGVGSVESVDLSHKQSQFYAGRE